MLEEIGDYYKEKLINGDYEFVSASEHTATLKFDREITFKVWIANDPKANFGFYTNHEADEQILIPHMQPRTQKQRLAAWRKLKPILKEKEDQLKAKRRKELEAELAKLK